MPIRIVVVTSGANMGYGVERGIERGIERAIVAHDVEGLVTRRFDAKPGTVFLVRPDQHICARWRKVDAASVHAALARATCND